MASSTTAVHSTSGSTEREYTKTKTDMKRVLLFRRTALTRIISNSTRMTAGLITPAMTDGGVTIHCLSLTMREAVT